MHFDIKKGGDVILRWAAEQLGGPLRIAPEVISHTPEERVIVLYTLFRGETERLRLIGKFYAGGVGRRAYQGMTALQSALSRAESAPLAAPASLFYDSVLDLIVQSYVTAVSYYDLIGREGAARYFQDAGAALAYLHRLDLRHGAPKRISDHLEELIHPHPLLFADTMPAYRTTVEGLIREMIGIEAGWGDSVQGAPIHRDFHLRQLFHDEKRVWLIDWDLFGRGDPALDVGNFIVYLETHLNTGLETAVAAFLEGYLRRAPSGLLERVPVYKALTYLRLACKRFRLKERDWRAQVAEMLRLSRAALENRGGDAAD